MCRQVAAVLEANTRRYAARLGLEPGHVPHVWSGELARGHVSSVAAHTPDHAVTLLHADEAVVLTILGTRVYPAPQVLYCTVLYCYCAVYPP